MLLAILVVILNLLAILQIIGEFNSGDTASKKDRSTARTLEWKVIRLFWKPILMAYFISPLDDFRLTWKWDYHKATAVSMRVMAWAIFETLTIPIYMLAVLILIHGKLPLLGETTEILAVGLLPRMLISEDMSSELAHFFRTLVGPFRTLVGLFRLLLA